MATQAIVGALIVLKLKKENGILQALHQRRWSPRAPAAGRVGRGVRLA